MSGYLFVWCDYKSVHTYVSNGKCFGCIQRVETVVLLANNLFTAINGANTKAGGGDDDVAYHILRLSIFVSFQQRNVH